MTDQPDPPVSPYRREDDANNGIGRRGICELCHRHTVCRSEHGLLACLDCHQELLPSAGVF